ncbi:unnamed protein product [Ectocarpus sp. 4 AP-2014]
MRCQSVCFWWKKIRLQEVACVFRVSILFCFLGFVLLLLGGDSRTDGVSKHPFIFVSIEKADIEGEQWGGPRGYSLVVTLKGGEIPRWRDYYVNVALGVACTRAAPKINGRQQRFVGTAEAAAEKLITTPPPPIRVPTVGYHNHLSTYPETQQTPRPT